MTRLITRPYWFLRHGQTDWNAANLSQGRTDVSLNEIGRAQAEAAGALFAKYVRNNALPVPFTHIVTSPLSRASVTADYVKRAIMDVGGPELPVRTEEGIIEVCFGVQEGQPMGDWYDPWIAEQFTPEGAESFSKLRERAVKAVNKALSEEGTPLIVAHGGVFRALRSSMRLPANVRLPNAVPVLARPENDKWTLDIYE